MTLSLKSFSDELACFFDSTSEWEMKAESEYNNNNNNWIELNWFVLIIITGREWKLLDIKGRGIKNKIMREKQK